MGTVRAQKQMLKPHRLLVRFRPLVILAKGIINAWNGMDMKAISTKYTIFVSLLGCLVIQ